MGQAEQDLRTRGRATGVRPAPVVPRPSSALLWTGGAALAFTLAQLVLSVPGTGLGWDEIVYVSQVERGTPTAYFSAPRARGITWLVAPVAAVVHSATTPVAVRLYLAVLSGLALFLALRVWRRLLPAPVLGCAGVLFAGCWITLFYGPRVMPNMWCALGALAATGWFLRASGVGDPPGRREAPLAGVAVAFVALMRPGDGLFLALPLTAAALLVPGWRRRRTVPALLVAGLVVGVLPWVAEAYLSYGGLLPRLRRAGEIQGGMGLHMAVDDQIRSLSGSSLCRPCDVPWRHPWTALWWFALWPLTAAGALAARRAGRTAASATAVVVALSLAVTYLFTIDYAAPRFLLPTYALLALQVSELLVAAVNRLTGRTPGTGPRTSGSGAGGSAGRTPGQPAGTRSGPAARPIAGGSAGWTPGRTPGRTPGWPAAISPGPVAESAADSAAGRIATSATARAALGTALALILLGHLAVQYAVLHGAVARSRNSHLTLTAEAAGLHRLGVRPPCVLTGGSALPLAYYAGCSSRQTGGHDRSATIGELLALGRRMPLAAVTAKGVRPPSYARTWRPHVLPGGRTAWVDTAWADAGRVARGTVGP
jgi:hypothetical protein